MFLGAKFDAGIQLAGEPVTDWQLGRTRLHGTTELEEIFSKGRLLRLFKATDSLAWALIDTWNGQDAYTEAAQAIRRVLAYETLEAAQAGTVPVTVMNMHKSKGKEFDGVIITEGQYNAPCSNQPGIPPEPKTLGESCGWRSLVPGTQSSWFYHPMPRRSRADVVAARARRSHRL